MNKNNAFIGTWLSIGSPVIAELAALSGFDWVLLDLEHGCAPEAIIPDQLRALGNRSAKGVVRVGAPHPDLIARALDWGADGIMVPHVSNADQAEAIVNAAFYPPRGKRGFSRTVRAHDYGLRTADSSRQPLILTQIETVDAVEQAPAIAAVDGVDVLFVGPADLQHDIQYRSPRNDLKFEDCLNRVLEAANSAAKLTGILVRDDSEASRRFDQGFNYVAVHSDLSLLRDSFGAIVRSAKGSGTSKELR